MSRCSDSVIIVKTYIYKWMLLVELSMLEVFATTHRCNLVCYRYNRTLEVLSMNMCCVGNTGFTRLLSEIRGGCYSLKTIKVRLFNNINDNKYF